MSLKALYDVSPLGMIGMFLLGGVFAAQFGMAAVYAIEAGLSIGQISIFVAMFYVGALVMQYPLGWLSDRMDRRRLIMITSAVGALAALIATLSGAVFGVLLTAAFVIGGTANPLYSLLAAYTNDFLEADDMPSASAGLLFINGTGAIAGPLLIGWAISQFGPPGFFVFLTVLMSMLTVYSAWRMTQRASPSVEDTGTYAPLYPSSTPVAMDAWQEYAVEVAEETAEEEAAHP